MRLIDADQIVGGFLIAKIAEAPTVEAIPLEWIHKNMPFVPNDDRPAIHRLVKQWEESRKEDNE